MASAKEHLFKLHTRLAEHHGAMADSYHALAACMGKTASTLHPDHPDNPAYHFAKLGAQHSALAEFHRNCAGDCEKLTEVDMTKLAKMFEDFGDQLQPMGQMSIVAPTKDSKLGGLTGIPRAGAPSWSGSGKDVEFIEKIFGDPSELHSNKGMG
jgi:hypothetical protein